LNNADTSTEYISTLRRGLEEEIVTSLGAGPNLPRHERAKLVSCLSGMGSAAAALRHVTDYGLQQLRASAVKPRTGPWVDAFLQASHQLSEVRSYNTCTQKLDYKCASYGLYYSL
jgi:hypothetical protein